MNCEDEYCFSMTTPCSELTDLITWNLTITLDSTDYKIPPLGYMLTPDKVYDEKCIIPISSTGDNSIAMLGDTFMRNYYTVFDFKNNEVKMAPNAVNAWSNTENLIVRRLSGGTIFLIVLACLVFISAICFIGYRCYQKKQQKKMTLGARAEAIGYTSKIDTSKLYESME